MSEKFHAMSWLEKRYLIYIFSSGGKSAVLTAIMVALGGKATVTSRGSTVKNFITTGKK